MRDRSASAACTPVFGVAAVRNVSTIIRGVFGSGVRGTCATSALDMLPATRPSQAI